MFSLSLEMVAVRLFTTVLFLVVVLTGIAAALILTDGKSEFSLLMSNDSICYDRM